MEYNKAYKIAYTLGEAKNSLLQAMRLAEQFQASASTIKAIERLTGQTENLQNKLQSRS